MAIINNQTLNDLDITLYDDSATASASQSGPGVSATSNGTVIVNGTAVPAGGGSSTQVSSNCDTLRQAWLDAQAAEEKNTSEYQQGIKLLQDDVDSLSAKVSTIDTIISAGKQVLGSAISGGTVSSSGVSNFNQNLQAYYAQRDSLLRQLQQDRNSIESARESLANAGTATTAAKNAFYGCANSAVPAGTASGSSSSSGASDGSTGGI